MTNLLPPGAPWPDRAAAAQQGHRSAPVEHTPPDRAASGPLTEAGERLVNDKRAASFVLAPLEQLARRFPHVLTRLISERQPDGRARVVFHEIKKPLFGRTRLVPRGVRVNMSHYSVGTDGNGGWVGIVDGRLNPQSDAQLNATIISGAYARWKEEVEFRPLAEGGATHRALQELTGEPVDRVPVGGMSEEAMRHIIDNYPLIFLDTSPEIVAFHAQHKRVPIHDDVLYRDGVLRPHQTYAVVGLTDDHQVQLQELTYSVVECAPDGEPVQLNAACMSGVSTFSVPFQDFQRACGLAELACCYVPIAESVAVISDTPPADGGAGGSKVAL